VLSTRAVQRPALAPSFEELFSELRGACDGLANMDRILDLVTRTMEAFSVLQVACRQWREMSVGMKATSGSKGMREELAASEKVKASAAAAFDTLTVCAREELGWQGSIAAFTERCGLYFSAYEDVTSPTLAAMQNLSSGMRLVVGWCFGQAEDLVLALAHSRSKRSSSLIERGWVTKGAEGEAISYSATGVLARGWRGVLSYPHSAEISLIATTGKEVSSDAISQVHVALQCSDLLAARAFRGITDMRGAQGESSAAALSKVAPNPLLVDKLCPQAALLLSLARLDYLVGGGTAECSSAKGLFRQVLERFVHAYLKAEDERKQQAAIKAQLYQNKAQEKVFESDDLKEELTALRIHFPDHLSEFRDITDTAKGPNGESLSRLVDEEDEDIVALTEEQKEEKETEAEDNELSLSVDPQTAALLIGYHSRMVFLHTMQHLATSGLLWVSSGQRVQAGVPVGQREALDSGLTTCSLMSAKGLDWGLRRLLSPSLEGELRGGGLNALSFMAEKSDTSSSSSSSNFWMERLTGVDSEVKEKRKRRERGKKGDSAAVVAVSVIDRDLLLLLDPSAEGPWHPKDFNADPHPEEVMLAAEPLRKLFDRATEVLQLYPGNELLVQVSLGEGVGAGLGVGLLQLYPDNELLVEVTQFTNSTFHSSPLPLTLNLTLISPQMSLDDTILYLSLSYSNLSLCNPNSNLELVLIPTLLSCQVCKVAARISELHTSTPVGKLLMTVQLLLVKAQEWEQFAAKHVSLQLEMAGLSVLIARWRELELKSWGNLLRCKEQGFVQSAMMYWFSLARCLF
jgi:hypothetical protein